MRFGLAPKPVALFLIPLLSYANGAPAPKCEPVAVPVIKDCLNYPEPVCKADLLKEARGFGEATRGGVNGPIYRVTSLADDGKPGTLRYGAESEGPLWIVFAVNGNIRLNKSSIQVRSNKTIDGRGAKVTISGFQLTLSKAYRDIIVNDLYFSGSSQDAVNIGGSASRLWVHHNHIEKSLDGLIDVKESATDVTLSWNIFGSQKDRNMLIAAGSRGVGGKITIHHNWWQGGYSRLPKIGEYKTHLVNNFYDQPQGKNDVICKGTCQLFAEGNFYVPKSAGNVVMVAEASDEGVWGRIRSLNNTVLNGGRIAEREASKVFNPRAFYKFSAEPADARLACKIRTLAGPRK